MIFLIYLFIFLCRFHWLCNVQTFFLTFLVPGHGPSSKANDSMQLKSKNLMGHFNGKHFLHPSTSSKTLQYLLEEELDSMISFLKSGMQTGDRNSSLWFAFWLDEPYT